MLNNARYISVIDHTNIGVLTNDWTVCSPYYVEAGSCCVYEPKGARGSSVGCAGCYCWGVFLLVRCTIALPKEVRLNSSSCFGGYEFINQSSPHRMKSENIDSCRSEPNVFFRGGFLFFVFRVFFFFFNLQQVETQELLLSTRKHRNNSSFLSVSVSDGLNKHSIAKLPALGMHWS